VPLLDGVYLLAKRSKRDNSWEYFPPISEGSCLIGRNIRVR
jgi:hypothetical protein